ncbi:tRNA (adenosine(37)-N6)-threonylcarbamoyltransferase complex dimerization subunit type 1 TsaB [Paenibacillus lemnae]|uniref:tRNA (Adenosine(37)-N6)-threonylcarbamoyltransferase complex dimerization subunit type 1 TsaB n=1 Tax=Paenibacillus lemnae TaxID=1330551 RepID=A0A848M4N2_PAELE|nr:tRNA (adenosine(37)-N6)-threonylcarbamoyltransferase complex dimerization subunit type 1 TsaB [Paenibacillus lemnae]NMO95735.1 tRNA (adenosine(37)-N6)-threonylcarbamoyltransferase complex dimerization subunit type 1 TsaB [Paenibacillus lemnae]
MNHHEHQSHQRILALDTSTSQLAAAVLEDDVLLKEINENGERNHSVHMHPIIERVVLASGLSVRDLDGIAVGVGPGSYTGVRMAVTAAKTLAWANRIPVVGVSSLHALAWGGLEQGMLAEKGHDHAINSNHWIIPLLDARRGQAYTALFEGTGGTAPKRLAPDGIRLMGTWVEELEERLGRLPASQQPAGIWFTGETGVHGPVAETLRENGACPVYVQEYELEGRWAGYLGAERLLRGEYDETHSLLPNYTQLSEAEANLLRRR